MRLGDRRVAWFASGPLYAAWAGGWYAELVEEGRIEAERLTMTYAGPMSGAAGAQQPLAVAWSDPGTWEGGDGGGGGDGG